MNGDPKQSVTQQVPPQETFNKVAEHLMRQGQKSVIGEECAYRGEAGLRCAAGCLIPDEIYRAGMEGRTWRALYGTNPEVRSLGHKLELVMTLQSIHDRKDVKEWPDALRELAWRWGFSLPSCLME